MKLIVGLFRFGQLPPEDSAASKFFNFFHFAFPTIRMGKKNRGYELRVQIHELRFQIYELRVQIHELEE